MRKMRLPFVNNQPKAIPPTPLPTSASDPSRSQARHPRHLNHCSVDPCCTESSRNDWANLFPFSQVARAPSGSLFFASQEKEIKSKDSVATSALTQHSALLKSGNKANGHELPSLCSVEKGYFEKKTLM